LDFDQLQERYEQWLDFRDDPYLVRGIYAAMLANRIKGNPLWLMIIGSAGCHEAGQEIILDSGIVKKVEDIVVGDALLGPDGKSRIVVKLERGTGNMVRIVPVKGESFVVNEDHVLTLCHTVTGEIIDVSVRDFRQWSKHKQRDHKLLRASAVSFNEREDEVPLDPYFLGLLLGDGCVRLRGLGLMNCLAGNKFIPDRYQFGSVEERQAILAGLIDTDGHLHGNTFDWISKSKQLADDVVFISRSLGLAAYVSECVKSCPGFTGTYHRVSISGDLTKLPVRVKRKKPAPRRQKKNVLHTGFTIEDVGEGEYYGFTLTGDGRYLLDDFTITHNCGKSELLMSFEDAANIYSLSSLTPYALMSGYGNSEETSLINKLDGKILVIKDMSSTTEIGGEDRGLLFSFLRDAYDGSAARATGRGEIRFTGKFGIVAAGTLDLEKGRKMESLLGERFLYIRPRVKGERIMEMSIRNATRKDEMRADLKSAAAEFLDNFEMPAKRTITRSIIELCKELARILVRVRSGVCRDGRSKEVDFPVEVQEVPTRVYEQFLIYALSLRSIGTSNELIERLCKRILLDSIPYVRMRCMESIADGMGTKTEIAKDIAMSISYTSRIVEDMELLGVVERSQRNEYQIISPTLDTALKNGVRKP